MQSNFVSVLNQATCGSVMGFFLRTEGSKGSINHQFRWTLLAQSDLHRIIRPFSNKKFGERSRSCVADGMCSVSLGQTFVGVESLQCQEADHSLPFPSA